MARTRVKEENRFFLRFLPLVLAFFAVWTLAGCSSGSLSNVFNSNSAGKGPLAPISFAPIIGAPSNVSSQLSGQLVSQAQQKKIPVVTEKGKSVDYTVRGYLAASQDQKSNKLAYIWDVTDKSGKRVHRIIGEEVTPTKAGRDAWSTFDKAALQKIATKTANDLAAWLPKQASGQAAQPAVATKKPVTGQSAKKPPADRSTRTASIKKGEVMAQIPNVSGAPGDGRKSLTKALKKQLFSKGIKLSSSSGNNVYTVRGKVKVSSASGGQQSVKIEWQVSDPNGKRLGTVSQANKVPKGTLDGKWGPIADAAASAAADGIVKLIPKR